MNSITTGGGNRNWWLWSNYNKSKGNKKPNYGFGFNGNGNRYNNYVEDVQEEKVPLPASREPGRVPTQVPSADLAQGLYKHPDSFITFKRAA